MSTTGLILTRRKGEVIFIGSNVKVTFLGLDARGRARIQVFAPPEISIDRAPVRESKLSEQGFNPGEVK